MPKTFKLLQNLIKYGQKCALERFETYLFQLIEPSWHFENGYTQCPRDISYLQCTSNRIDPLFQAEVGHFTNLDEKGEPGQDEEQHRDDEGDDRAQDEEVVAAGGPQFTSAMHADLKKQRSM